MPYHQVLKQARAHPPVSAARHHSRHIQSNQSLTRQPEWEVAAASGSSSSKCQQQQVSAAAAAAKVKQQLQKLTATQLFQHQVRQAISRNCCITMTN